MPPNPPRFLRFRRSVDSKMVRIFPRSAPVYVCMYVCFHLDTATGAFSQKYTTLQLDRNGQNIASTDSTGCYEGFTKRKGHLSIGAENNVLIPLN